jgi:hypothetical protein
MKHFILWKYPSLNFALKYISYHFSQLYGLHQFCINMLENAKNTAIIFYMPQLIQAFRTETSDIVEKFIIKKSKESSHVAHQFLWSLEVEEVMGPTVKHRFLEKNFEDRVFETAKIVRLNILKNLSPMQRKFWHDENSIFSNINEISAKFLHLDENPQISLKMTKQEKTKFVRDELEKLPKKIPAYIYLPTNPNFRLTEILPNTASSLQSAKKVPFVVSFLGRKYEGPDSDYLVTQMNFSEFLNNEIIDYRNYLQQKNKIIVNNDNNNYNNANNEGNYIFQFPLSSRENNILNYDVNSKNFFNKSTTNTNFVGYNDNNNNDPYNRNSIEEESEYSVGGGLVRNNTGNLNNKNNNNMLLGNDNFNEDDDLEVYDEQDNFSDLNIPHLDIKIFGKNENDGN